MLRGLHFLSWLAQSEHRATKSRRKTHRHRGCSYRRLGIEPLEVRSLLSVAPTVATVAATAVGSTSATLNAQISSTGGAAIAQERFSWGSTPSCSDGYTSAVTVNGNSFSYALTGLTPGHAYYYQPWADNTAGWGVGQALSFTTTSTVTLPNAPSNLKGSVTSATQASLSWTDNSNNETGFQIERWNGSAWTQIGSVGANVTTYADSGLSPSSTYYYDVVAYNSAGTNWATSDAVVTTPAAAATLPNAPSNLKGSVTSATQASLSWTDNSNNETGFQIERWNGSAWTQIGSVGANVTTYADSGLSPSSTYYYDVVAYNSAGTNWATSDAVVTTPAAAATLPNAPSNLKGSVTSATQASLSWTDNSNNETGFQIERWNGSAWTQIGSVGANVTTYADSGLSPSSTYYYDVVAYNSAGTNWATSDAVVTTPAAAATLPNAPSNLKGSVTSATQASLSWTDNSNNETGFQIERWNGSAWTQIGSVGANVTTYADSGLSPSSTYYYDVVAYNSAGTNWATSDAVVTTPAAAATLPNAPSNLKGSVTSATQASLSWTDNSNNETGFQIEALERFGLDADRLGRRQRYDLRRLRPQPLEHLLLRCSGVQQRGH